MGGALVFDGGGRSQEDASTFGTGESAVLVIMIIVPPGNIVRDQVPAVVLLVLGGVGKDWGDWRGDGAEGGDGETARVADIWAVVGVRGEIQGRDGEVRGEFSAVVLDLERDKGERDGEGHGSEQESEKRGREVWTEVGSVLIYGRVMIEREDWLANL